MILSLTSGYRKFVISTSLLNDLLTDRKKFMPNLAVIGAQWGDEGKGKIIDVLSDKAEIIVRFQGGHNAGHTLSLEAKLLNYPYYLRA